MHAYFNFQHKHVIFASGRRRIHNTNTFVTNYSLEQSLFISVYSGTLDPYFHRAVISSLALDVAYFFFKPLFFIILFLLTIQIPIKPLNPAGMKRTERTILQCLPWKVISLKVGQKRDIFLVFRKQIFFRLLSEMLCLEFKHHKPLKLSIPWKLCRMKYLVESGGSMIVSDNGPPHYP